jgi:hypothetical protein
MYGILVMRINIYGHCRFATEASGTTSSHDRRLGATSRLTANLRQQFIELRGFPPGNASSPGPKTCPSPSRQTD